MTPDNPADASIRLAVYGTLAPDGRTTIMWPIWVEHGQMATFEVGSWRRDGAQRWDTPA